MANTDDTTVNHFNNLSSSDLNSKKAASPPKIIWIIDCQMLKLRRGQKNPKIPKTKNKRAAPHRYRRIKLSLIKLQSFYYNILCHSETDSRPENYSRKNFQN